MLPLITKSDLGISIPENSIAGGGMCGTIGVQKRLAEEYLECRARRAEMSDAPEATLSENPSFRRTCGLTTIPGVVDVVYDNDTENVSDDQITGQIEALNRDYRANNSDTGQCFRCVEKPWQR
jgi:hypothetical protein